MVKYCLDERIIIGINAIKGRNIAPLSDRKNTTMCWGRDKMCFVCFWFYTNTRESEAQGIEWILWLTKEKMIAVARDTQTSDKYCKSFPYRVPALCTDNSSASASQSWPAVRHASSVLVSPGQNSTKTSEQQNYRSHFSAKLPNSSTNALIDGLWTFSTTAAFACLKQRLLPCGFMLGHRLRVLNSFHRWP